MLRHNFYQCHLVGHPHLCDLLGAMRPSGWTARGWKRAKRRGGGTQVGVYLHAPGHHRGYRLCEYGLTYTMYDPVRRFG